MNTIKNKYRYELTDRLGVVDVSPLNEADFVIKWSRESEGKYFFSKGLEGKITFTGSTYKRLKQIEESQYICSEQQLRIYQRCAGVDKLIFDGFFKLMSGDWQPDKCRVILKFEKNVPDRCLQLKKSEKINLANAIFNRTAVKMYVAGGGTFERVSYNKRIDYVSPSEPYGGYVWEGEGQPSDGNWQVENHYEILKIGQGFGPPGDNGDAWEASTQWVREIVVLDAELPQPPNYIFVSYDAPTNTKKYAKAARLYNCQYRNVNDYNNYETFYNCSVIGANQTSGSEVRNGYRLGDILQLMVSRACPGATVVSDFFQINPSERTNINYVTNELSEVQDIFLFQKSDVKRPTASGYATRAEISFDKLLEALNVMFNVVYSVEGNVFRFEHISYFSRAQGLDLTASKYARFIAGKTGYTYDNQEIPGVERWQFKEQMPYRDAWRGEIEYRSECASTEGQGDNDKIYTVEEIMTDVEYALQNPAPDSNVVQDEGFVMVAARKYGADFYAISDEAEGDDFVINNTLGWRSLVRKYHFHDRYLKNGFFNGAPVQFATTKPIKKGDKISVPLCCDQVFNPNDFIVLPEGNAIIKEAVLNLGTNMLELTPYYDVFSELEPNIPPTIQGATFEMYQDTAHRVDVVSSDQDGQVVALKISRSPAHGSLTVDGIQGVIYTPAAGYVGTDFFRLRAVDNWSEESNEAIFYVTVKAAAAEPVAQPDSYNVFQGVPFTANPGIFANDGQRSAFTLLTPNVTTAQGVSVEIPADGRFTYTPPDNFEGTDTFVYQIESDRGNATSATVSLVVKFRNKPVTRPDSYQTRRNTVLITDGTAGKERLYANDYTPDGINYGFTTNAENKATAKGGTVQITTDGLFTYTPPNNFTGQDTFSYTVNNPNGSAVGDVTINVLPTVYVRLEQSAFRTEPQIIECGNPPQMTIVGTNSYGDFTLHFYSNAAGTTPYDVTGLGLSVNIQESQSNSQGSSSFVYPTGVVSGTSYLLYEDFILHHELATCQGVVDSADKNLTLAPGSYEIIN